MEKTVLTVEEMGTMLNLSRSKAYELVHSEASPPVIRIGRCIRIPTDGLERGSPARVNRGQGYDTIESHSGKVP